MNKTPEQKARDNIDKMLEQSGWAVVDKNAINWSLGPGVAVREGVKSQFDCYSFPGRVKRWPHD